MNINWTPDQWITLIGGVLLALFTFVTQIVTLIRTNRNGQKTDKVIAATEVIQNNASRVSEKTELVINKQDFLGTKLEEVHVQTNSRMMRMEGELKEAIAKLALKEEEAVRNEATRLLLADAAAQALRARETNVPIPFTSSGQITVEPPTDESRIIKP